MNAIPTITKMEVFPVAGHDCMELQVTEAFAKLLDFDLYSFIV